ncbi:MAG: DUF4230 domain-containing protein [Muribaculaceae bacterium]|nr:DUF4230 domain-containing protein [Muribaculaceae bacterium]
MKKYLILIIVILLLILAGLGGWLWFSEEAPDEGMQLREARIKSIKEMVELCTLDVHEEMAIKDSINGKWIVARQTIEGRVRFNLDSLRVEEQGDTLVVYLPPERIDILESADKDAYKVLDTWDGRPSLFSRTMTAQEENIIKRRWQNKARERFYERGYVSQARDDAKATLRSLFEASGQPIVIVDPFPAPQRVEQD